jgi:glycosyltransferase involved in cell wall biosynthesis
MGINNERGGLCVKLNELIEGLASRDWTIHHISPKGFKYANHKNVIHHEIINFRIYLRSIPYMLQVFFVISRILRKERIDVILSFSLADGFVCSLLKILKTDVKVIVFLRGDSIAGVNIHENKILKVFYIKILKAMERFLLRRSDLVMFVSNETRKQIMKRANYNHFEKTKVIYNNINNLRTERLSKGKSIEFYANKKVLGYVGTLGAKGKGLKYLIDAFYTVKQEIPNSLLVIVGDGPYLYKQKLILQVRNLGLEGDVVFTGFKKNPFPYIKSFDLMVHPSITEGFSNTILEALYCDIPVIGSRVGGIPEALKYDELLFEVENIDELSSKIVNLLRNYEAYKRAVDLCRERKRVFTFDWIDEVAKATEDCRGVKNA